MSGVPGMTRPIRSLGAVKLIQRVRAVRRRRGDLDALDDGRGEVKAYRLAVVEGLAGNITPPAADELDGHDTRLDELPRAIGDFQLLGQIVLPRDQGRVSEPRVVQASLRVGGREGPPTRSQR